MAHLRAIRERWAGLRRWLLEEDQSPARLFRASAGLALLLHAVLVLRRSGIWGGGDLLPHLRLIERFAEEPGLHNPYAPAYHALGALLVPLVGFDAYTRLFALLGAGLWIAGFRYFQRAAGLPDTAAILFALTPYGLALSYCIPKVEAVGYGAVLLGLGLQLRGRHGGVALTLAATFWVHTASAILAGLAGGVLALARRDGRALAALAVGALGVAPLAWAHVEAGCSPAEALLFAGGGYTGYERQSLVPRNWIWLVPLAGPVALFAAAAGARRLWREHRPLGILCVALVVVYLNNLWLAPFDIRTLVTLLRGLSVLAIPVAIAAGLWAAAQPRVRDALVGLSAAWLVLAALWFVPKACYVQPLTVAEIETVTVERCAFAWRRLGARRRPAPAPVAP